MRNLKSGKSFDNIPVETLQNQTAITFLHKLFHNCFEEGDTPFIQLKEIIQSIQRTLSVTVE